MSFWACSAVIFLSLSAETAAPGGWGLGGGDYGGGGEGGVLM